VHFRLEQFLPGPLEQVEAAFVDPALLARLAELPYLGHPRLLDQREEGPLVHQRVRYAFVGELSSAVTRFVDPAKLTWIEVSTLDRRTHITDFEIQPDHYANRLTCRGRMRLTPEGGEGAATRRTAEGDLTVHIPFVGRKAEQAIISGLTDHARIEAETLGRWLKQRA
jgi:hypothetical protein